MSEVVGEGVIHIRTDSAGVNVAGEGQKAGSAYSKGFLGSIKSMAVGIGAVLAAREVVGFAKDSIAEAREAQKVGAQSEAQIKATGGSANVTAKQIGDLSTALSLKTGVDDEAIQSGANLVLAFQNIANEAGKGNDIFDRTVASTQDLAAAGLGSVTSASKALGKALNDPLTGLGGLSKAGVVFTAGQKDQIKQMVEQNDLLGAQKLILGEVEGKVGGVAEATATNGEKATVAWANLQETLGTALLPVLDKIEAVFAEKIVPAITNFVGQIQSGSGAGGEFAAVFQAVFDGLSAVFEFIGDHQDLFTFLVTAIIAATVAAKAFAAAQLLVNLALEANPIGLLVVALGALVGGLIFAYHHSERFRAIVDATFGFLKEFVPAAISFVVGFVKDHWGLLVAIIGGPIGLVVVLVIKHFSTIKAAVVGVVTFVVNAVKGIVSAVAAVPGQIVHLGSEFLNAGKTVIGKLLDGIKAIGSGAGGIAESVANAIKGAVNGMIDRLNGLLEFTINVGPKSFTVNAPNIGHLAGGTDSWRGGWSWVGEQGPELVNLPRGTKVLPAGQSAALAGGAGTATINVHMPTGDPEAAGLAVMSRLVSVGFVGGS